MRVLHTNAVGDYAALGAINPVARLERADYFACIDQEVAAPSQK